MGSIRYKDIANRFDYSFHCPVGMWKARLDAKAWGRKSNILLYLTELDTGARYCLSIFWNDRHRPREGGISFKTEGEPGDVFELETARTNTGMPKLVWVRAASDAPDGCPAQNMIGSNET